MHEKIKSVVKIYEENIKCVKLMEEKCAKADELVNALVDLDGVVRLSWSVGDTHITFNLRVSGVKYIPNILKEMIKSLGKITYRDVKPNEKFFSFDFKNFWTYFYLDGDSCKLVQISSETKEVPIYELQCSNGTTETITKEELMEVGEEPENVSRSNI